MNQYEQKIANDLEIQNCLKSGVWEAHVRNRYLGLSQLARGEQVNIPRVNAGPLHAILTQKPKAPVRHLNTPAEQVGASPVPPEVLAEQRRLHEQRYPRIPEIEPFEGGGPGPGALSSDDLLGEGPDLSSPAVIPNEGAVVVGIAQTGVQAAGVALQQQMLTPETLSPAVEPPSPGTVKAGARMARGGAKQA